MNPLTVAGGLGVLSTTVGITCLVGYFTGLEVLYAWINGAKMAFPTAIGFVAVGAAIVMLAEETMRLECRGKERSGDR